MYNKISKINKVIVNSNADGWISEDLMLDWREKILLNFKAPVNTAK